MSGDLPIIYLINHVIRKIGEGSKDAQGDACEPPLSFWNNHRKQKTENIYISETKTEEIWNFLKTAREYLNFAD